MSDITKTDEHMISVFRKSVENAIQDLEKQGISPVYYEESELDEAQEEFIKFMNKIVSIKERQTLEQLAKEATHRYFSVLKSSQKNSEKKFNPVLWVRAAKALNEDS